MTKKDYILFAGTLAKARRRLVDAGLTEQGDSIVLTWDLVILPQIMDDLQQDNPRFDRAKFASAAKMHWVP